MVRVLRAGTGALLTALCLMLVILAPSVAVSQEKEAANGRENPVVVIGFSGLLWRDITQEDTPHLYQFLESSAGANMVVRTVDETTCPSEGWLTIGAGQRAIDPTNGCSQIGARGWDSLVQANLASNYRAELGLLGDTLAGESLAAIGPGAELALTDSSGNFEGEYADLAPLPGSVEGTDPYASDTATGDAAAAFANVANSDLVAVDLGSVRYPGDELNPVGAPAEEYRPRGAIDKFLAAFKGTGAPPAEVKPQVAALDARFGALMAAVDELAPGVRVLVVSVGDAQESAPQLGFMSIREASVGAAGTGTGVEATAASEGTGGTLATSDATRQPGLVQLTDVFPTIVSWIEPDTPVLERVVGSEIRTGEGAQSADHLVSRLADDQERSENVRPFVGPFYVAVMVLVVVAALASWRVLRQPIGAKVPRGIARFSAWVAALPVASLLINVVPWWRFAVPGAALFVGIGVIAALIVAVAYAVPHRDKVEAPIALIGGFTALTLVLDVLLDTVTNRYSLQLASLLGTQPQVGGRFYGLSNASFAIMAAGLLLAVAYVVARVPRRWGAVVLVGVGIGAVLIDGMATLGADFGGPPALVVGFVLAGLLIYGVRLTPVWVLGTLVVALATSLIFSFVDYLRPANARSHLGRFIQTVLDGGGFEVITRKLSQSLFGLPWWLAIIVFLGVGAAAVIWWYRRTPRPARQIERLGELAWRDVPILHHTAFPVIAALVFGMVINDSGVVIPAIGMAVAGLLWASAALEYAGSSAATEFLGTTTSSASS